MRKHGTHPSSVYAHFRGDIIIQCRKEEFLSNETNKQHLINHLRKALQNADCSVKHAEADADLLIAEAVALCSIKRNSSDETDLSIL